MQHSIIRKWRIRHLMNSYDVFVIKGFTVYNSYERHLATKLSSPKVRELHDHYMTTIYRDWTLYVWNENCDVKDDFFENLPLYNLLNISLEIFIISRKSRKWFSINSSIGRKRGSIKKAFRILYTVGLYTEVNSMSYF